VSTAAGRARAMWTTLTGTGAAVSAVLALMAIAVTFVAVGTPRASLGYRTRALQQLVARTPAEGKSVAGDIDFTTLSLGLGTTDGEAASQIFPGEIQTMAGELAANLRKLGLPLAPPALRWTGLTSGYSVVGGAARRAYNGSTAPQVEVVYRGRLSQFARLATGSMPVADSVTRAMSRFQVAVTAATAARFGLHPGSVLAVGTNVTLAVTGVIRLTSPGSTFWTADPNAAAATFNKTPSGGYWLGAVFIGRAEVADLESAFDTSQMRLHWDFPLDLARVSANQAGRLYNGLAAANVRGGLLTSSVNAPTSIGISAGLAGTLATFIQTEGEIGSLLSLLYVSLAIVGTVVLLLGSRLVAERRAAEFGLMRARGAAFWQLGWLALRAGLVVVLPAGLVGAALAVAVTPGGAEPLAWWLGGLTVLAALISVPAAAISRTPATGLSNERADRLPGQTSVARRWVRDVALVAAAAGGLVVLRQQGQPPPGGTDLYTSAAPVLVAIPVAIVIVRGYPTIVRWLVQLAGRQHGVTAFVGLARAARSALTAVLPTFALILALAVIAFGATLRAAEVRGQITASWQSTGADALIDASLSVQPLDRAVQRAIAAVPGVERTTSVSVISGLAADGTPIAIVIVSPASYAALIADTPDPPFPAAALARPPGTSAASPGSAAAGPIPVLASPAAATIIGRGTNVLAGIRTLRIAAVGKITSTPAIPAGTGPFVVLPRWAAGARPPQPNLMLVAGSRLDAGRLQAVVRRTLPGAAVTLRSTVLASLTSAELPHGAYATFAEGAAAAAVFGAAILLIMLVLGARPRELTLARLATMGLSPGQARRLVFAEALPAIVAAAAGGTACAWALVPLIGPAVNLSALTGSDTPTPVRTDLPVLGYAAAGLLLLALATLFAQSASTRIRGTARALRVGE
jgi:putative ABC transport system permease protein